MGAAVIVLGGLAAARAAEDYHLLKKYSIRQAEGATREYFDYITVDSAARTGGTWRRCAITSRSSGSCA